MRLRLCLFVRLVFFRIKVGFQIGGFGAVVMAQRFMWILSNKTPNTPDIRVQTPRRIWGQVSRIFLSGVPPR